MKKVQERNWTKSEYNYKDKFYFPLRITRSVGFQTSIINSLYMNHENVVCVKQTHKKEVAVGKTHVKVL